MRVWDASEGELWRTIQAGASNALYCIGATHDGGVVGVGCRHSQVQLWDLETGQSRGERLGHSKEVYCLQFGQSSAEKLLLSGSGDATVKVWDLSSGACAMTLRDHTATVMALQVLSYHH